MSPTILNEFLLVNHFSCRVLSPSYHKGEIICFINPLNPQSMVCKRIAAVAGEEVNYNGNVVKVPDQHVWVLGDNLEMSRDSREYGFVSITTINGKIWRRWKNLELVK